MGLNISSSNSKVYYYNKPLPIQQPNVKQPLFPNQPPVSVQNPPAWMKPLIAAPGTVANPSDPISKLLQQAIPLPNNQNTLEYRFTLPPEAQKDLEALVNPPAATPNPAIPSALQQYLSQPPANESAPPQLLGQLGFNYGSAAAPGVVSPVNDAGRPYIVGALPSPPELQTMATSGIANAFNPEWQQAVASYVQQNGGLGNEQDGYLAFSDNYGFVRLRNPNLTPEQNRRMAEISLTMGMPVEKLPSRSDSSAITNPDVNQWANDFISKYDTKMQTFLADPSQGLQLKDGKRRFKLDYDPQSGRVISQYYKKASGFQSFMQGAMKYISPIANAVSLIPGVGVIGIAAAQAIKFGAGMLATGKATASGILGAVSGFLPGLGQAAGLTGSEIAAGEGLLKAGAGVIDNGKINFGNLAKSLGPSLFAGLPDASLYQAGLGALGKALDGGKFSAKDLINVLTPLAGALGITGNNTHPTGAKVGAPGWVQQIASSLGINLGGSDFNQLSSIGGGLFKAITNGQLSAGTLANSLGGLTPQLANDPEDQILIGNLFNGVGSSIDSGQMSLDQLLNPIADAVDSPMLDLAADLV